MSDDLGNELHRLADEFSARMSAQGIIGEYREEAIRQRNSLPRTPHSELIFPDGTIVYAEKATVEDMARDISKAGVDIRGTEVDSVSAERVRELRELYSRTLDTRLKEALDRSPNINHKRALFDLTDPLKLIVSGVFEPPKIHGYDVVDRASLEQAIEKYTPDLGA